MQRISIDRILDKLDEYLNKNDYVGAERHLLYWRGEAELCRDHKAELLVCNELMGLYRKLSRRDEALKCVSAALLKIESLEIAGQVGAATTFLNCATVYKAFGEPQRSIDFLKQQSLYMKKSLTKTTRARADFIIIWR